jgi:hypothetical protein
MSYMPPPVPRFFSVTVTEMLARVARPRRAKSPSSNRPHTLYPGHDALLRFMPGV